jgi:pyruvate kinase
MTREILCTLGPASLSEREIRRLADVGVSLFRINLSHTSLGALPGLVAKIRAQTDVPVCLDSEGAQIRTGRLAGGRITVHEHNVVRIHKAPIVGDPSALSLYPFGVTAYLNVGNLISIDFNSVLVQVIDKDADTLTVRVLTGGDIGQNKAVSVLDGEIALPAMTAKDIEAFRWGSANRIRHVALSFAHSGEDVDSCRALCAAETMVMAKIECLAALDRLEEIASRADALLIDRGDLSREILIERIPALQKRIIATARATNRKVYVATNLLESMITASTPTRAEVNDIYNTLLDGADGLVLAAETAIGKHPVGCVRMVARLIREFEEDQKVTPDIPLSVAFSPDPQGSILAHREHDPAALEGLENLTQLVCDEQDLIDAENIALGTYSPLTGFMTASSVMHVLEHGRLPTGAPWTIPILLQADPAIAQGLTRGERVCIVGPDNAVHSILEVTEVSRIRPERLALLWFGTSSPSHPGVARLLQKGDHLVAGDVTLARKRRRHQFELTPWQSRTIFASKGWNRIVSFRTHNIPSRVHEHIQRMLLEESGADGLLINAAARPGIAGDWTVDLIVRSYQMLLEASYLPSHQILLSTSPHYPRHCDMRDIIFRAICDKNFGCTHVVIGTTVDSPSLSERDRIAAQLQEVEIEPVFVEKLGWDPAARKFAPPGDTQAFPSSSAEIRRRLSRGELLPDWLIRPEIQDLLHAERAAGRPLFAA